VRADLLILLSDVDGLYTADPRSNPDARHLPLVESLEPEVLAMAGGANVEADMGTGGMATKLEAARIARSAGCATLIVSGLAMRPLSAVASGARATLITATATPLQAYKSWIAGSLEPAGALAVDDGAAVALSGGRSLLVSGVNRVDGRFDRGDCVRVLLADGGVVGVGLAAYAADEMERIRGRHSGEIEALVGYKGPGVAIHRDDLVAIVVAALDDASYSGVYNGVAPAPATMAQFSAALGRSLGRPSLLPVPGPILQLLLGDGAQVVLKGQRVLPERLQQQGFRFRYPELSAALAAATSPGSR
jgi:hypothetical protein